MTPDNPHSNRRTAIGDPIFAGLGLSADERAAPLHIVVQKGRAFQRQHPHARVLADRGRYLVAELPPDLDLAADHGCFAVRPFDPAFRAHPQVDVSPAERRVDTAAILEQLDELDLLDKLRTLTGIHTRHALEPGFTTALEVCEAWLQAAGCATHREAVALPGGVSHNLIGERRGSAAAPALLIVCAHLDSINEAGRTAPAPGADDNASGSVGVCAIAAACRDLAFTHDLRFILFTGEESGLHGSRRHLAGMSAADRARLAGVVNMDMIASKNTPNPAVLLESSEASRPLVESLATLAATYTNLVVQLSFEPYASDHVPFIRAGLPAVLTIEGTDGAYEHEHTERDTLDRLDLALLHEILRMNLAWVCETAR